jgi:Flp pilus assembly protein TadB
VRGRPTSQGALCKSVCRLYVTPRSERARIARTQKRDATKGAGMELGGKFFLTLAGICIGALVGLMLVVFLVGWAWYAWGFLGALLFFGLILLGLAWAYDRRQQRPLDG